MYGAIIGDVAGSRFEFDRGGKTKKFQLFTNSCHFTDDTVMTVAVADGLMSALASNEISVIKQKLCESMTLFGYMHPNAGYGAKFIYWLFDKQVPYNSFGNGSAMRVSSVGWLYDSLEETRKIARATSEISHNHPEGIKGADCTASVIYLGRTGATKEEIREFVEKEFDYDLSESLDELRQRHEHVETCMDSMPKALVSFFEGNNYEEVIRNAISLGGDTDTLGAIAGGMAEGMYEIPTDMIRDCKTFLTRDLEEVADEFYNLISNKTGKTK